MCKRYGLEIGAYCSWLVRAIMVITAPVSWPLGKALDALLGEESVLFRRQELNALISLHAEPQHDGSGGRHWVVFKEEGGVGLLPVCWPLSVSESGRHSCTARRMGTGLSRSPARRRSPQPV